MDREQIAQDFSLLKTAILKRKYFREDQLRWLVGVMPRWKLGDWTGVTPLEVGVVLAEVRKLSEFVRANGIVLAPELQQTMWGLSLHVDIAYNRERVDRLLASQAGRVASVVGQYPSSVLVCAGLANYLGLAALAEGLIFGALVLVAVLLVAFLWGFTYRCTPEPLPVPMVLEDWCHGVALTLRWCWRELMLPAEHSFTPSP